MSMTDTAADHVVRVLPLASALEGVVAAAVVMNVDTWSPVLNGPPSRPWCVPLGVVDGLEGVICEHDVQR